MRRRLPRRVVEATWIGAISLSAVGVAMAFNNPLPTTQPDYFAAGSQPLEWLTDFGSANGLCIFCHSNEDFNDPNINGTPYEFWSSSLMAQTMRNPVMQAALRIAEQDAPGSGESCLRCHSPMGWINGRSTPSDGSALLDDGFSGDFEGVSCSICHRMVDPIYTPGQSPMDDIAVLTGGDLNNNPENPLNWPGLASGVPVDPHNGNYVLDVLDRRRAPNDLETDWAGSGGFFLHDWRQSPFHQSSRLCATCHEVSNPLLTRQPDNTYALNAHGAPGPASKYDQFPEQRTYSEWLMSSFATGPIDMTGRFGGNDPLVSTCQDCHMQDITGEGCVIGGVPTRTDLPQHTFNGASSWVIQEIHRRYPPDQFTTGLTNEKVALRMDRNRQMLELASDLELSSDGSTLTARVINFTGHKLPTGYPEGRRMWVNVKYFDATDALLNEHGAYDDLTADLDVASTKVYEAKLGLSADISAAVGGKVPAGESGHLMLVNEILQDNRIPPMGFTNANFEAVQAPVVGATYADGQYWDDTDFAIPAGTVRAEVRVFYQSTTKAYAEFLRDTVDSETSSEGLDFYEGYEFWGKSPPVEMDFEELVFTAPCPCDWDGSGILNSDDFFAFLTDFFSGSADFNNDSVTNSDDFFEFLNCFFSPPMDC